MDDSAFLTPEKESPVPLKKARKSDVPVLQADRLSVDMLRGAHAQCPICSKELTHLSDLRRSIHVNACIDTECNKKAVEKAKKEAETMFPCPCCREPVGKGPYLVAHATKCAKTFNVPVAQMLKALETQAVVSAQLRKQGLQQSAPLNTELIQKAKRQLMEEETRAKSTKQQEDTSPVPVKAAPKRKAMPNHFRSLVFGPKESASCRCKELHIIQNRFCEQFKNLKQRKVVEDKHKTPEASIISRKLRKLDSLARLADDLKRSLTAQKCDGKLIAKDGKSVAVHVFMITARSRLKFPFDSNDILLQDFSLEALELYVQFLYTATIGWTIKERDEIARLAELYGPLDLQQMMNSNFEELDEVAPQMEPILVDEDSDEVFSDSVVFEPVFDRSRKSDFGHATAADKPRVFQRSKQHEESSNRPSTTVQQEIGVQPSAVVEDEIERPCTPFDRILPSSPITNHSDSVRARKFVSKLGSGVKLLKTKDVTPMPSFENFSEAEIKKALADYGLRPMGRKKAIEMLKRIYDETHPVVEDIRTPVRPVRPVLLDFDEAVESTSLTSNGSESESATLNNSDDEPDNVEESAFFDGDDMDSGSTGSPTKFKLIRDVSAAQKLMIEWLRLPENEEMYNQLLALRPISWDDLVGAMSRSNHPVGKITKKILAEVLDRLHITFTLPDVKWGRRPKGFKCG